MSKVFITPFSCYNGVYKRNKKWFDTQKDTNNPKANAYKLLDGGKKHAESLLTK